MKKKESRSSAATLKRHYGENQISGFPSRQFSPISFYRADGQDATKSLHLPRMISITEAIAATGLKYNFLRGLCLSGEVACIRAGHTKWLINADSLADYLRGGGKDDE